MIPESQIKVQIFINDLRIAEAYVKGLPGNYSIGVLTGIWVDENFRRKGYGERVMQMAIERAIAHDVKIIFATILCMNSPMWALAKKMSLTLVKEFVSERSGESCGLWWRIFDEKKEVV